MVRLFSISWYLRVDINSSRATSSAVSRASPHFSLMLLIHQLTTPQSQDQIALLVGFLVAGGGITGYVRTGSIPSVVAGCSVGLLVRLLPHPDIGIPKTNNCIFSTSSVAFGSVIANLMASSSLSSLRSFWLDRPFQELLRVESHCRAC